MTVEIFPTSPDMFRRAFERELDKRGVTDIDIRANAVSTVLGMLSLFERRLEERSFQLELPPQLTDEEVAGIREQVQQVVARLEGFYQRAAQGIFLAATEVVIQAAVINQGR